LLNWAAPALGELDALNPLNEELIAVLDIVVS
jgi:hypothetical protein